MSQETLAVAQDAFLEHGTWDDMLELQRRWMFERFARGLPVSFVSKGGWIARAIMAEPGPDPIWSVTFIDHHFDDEPHVPVSRSVTHEWVRSGIGGALGFVSPDSPDLRLTARSRY